MNTISSVKTSLKSNRNIIDFSGDLVTSDFTAHFGNSFRVQHASTVALDPCTPPELLLKLLIDTKLPGVVVPNFITTTDIQDLDMGFQPSPFTILH